MNKKVNNKTNPLVNVFIKTQIIFIVVASTLITVLSLVLFSIYDVPSQTYFYIISSIIALSNFISGFYTGFKIRKNGMINAFIFCLPMNILLFLISVVMNMFKPDLTLLFSVIISASASMLGGILSVNTKNVPRGKRVDR